MGWGIIVLGHLGQQLEGAFPGAIGCLPVAIDTSTSPSSAASAAAASGCPARSPARSGAKGSPCSSTEPYPAPSAWSTPKTTGRRETDAAMTAAGNDRVVSRRASVGAVHLPEPEPTVFG